MRVTKGRFITAALISATLLMVLLNGSLILQAAQGVFPTPLPVTPPPPGTTPIPEASIEPLGQRLPSYFVTVPSFAGKVLHWTRIDYSYNTTSLDPANGQPVTGEIWEQVGDDGIPIKVHGRYIRPNGTFHQETVQTRDEITTVMGAGYPKPPPSIKTPRCSASPWRRSPDAMRGLLPPFVDEGMLPQSGFRMSGGLTKQLPTTMSLAGVKPILTYGPDTSARRWVSRQTENGLTNLKASEVGAQGRVLVAQALLINPAGQVINETWAAYGSLEVYDPVSVPASVFNLSQQAQEECRG